MVMIVVKVTRPLPETMDEQFAYEKEVGDIPKRVYSTSLP